MALNEYKELLEEIKKYVTLQVDYTKYTTIEKMVVLFSAIAMALIFGGLGFCVLFYISIALSSWLSVLIGSVWGAHLMVAGLYALLLLLVVLNRKQWIEDPIARFLTKLFLKPKA